MTMNVEQYNTVAWKEDLRTALQGFSGALHWDAPIAPFTSLKVGGTADLLLVPASVSDLALAMPAISALQLPCFVLGQGSNLIVKDGGIEGVVLHLKHFKHMERIGNHRLFAQSGAAYPKLALFAMEQGLSGLEFACGIPGSVGGAVAMNAGIPNAETAEVLESITLVAPSGHCLDLPARDLGFSYRRTQLPEGIVVDATFVLHPSAREIIEHNMKHLLKRRQITQPLQKPNCGSVFKNPPGHHAGALIEAAGLKGFHVGDAQISERHANFIINLGRAQAADCLALINKIQDTVRQKQGIALELEVKIIGRP